MGTLFEKIEETLDQKRDNIKRLRQQYGKKEVSRVTISQILGGMRNIKSLLCNTSEVMPDHGLVVREIPIGELTDTTPEEIFWLLVTGDMPNKEEIDWISNDLKKRAVVPEYVWDVLKAMPADSHPMTMLNTAILCMQKESLFFKKYEEGLKKEDYWIWTLEDSLNLIAMVPVIAAGIYRMRFKNAGRIDADTSLDLSGNFAKMLGVPDPNGEFKDLIRLYLVLHCDHEGGNVSQHTSSVVNSALSDLYYSLSAGLNGLAGPLHGLANQECFKWVLSVMEKLGDNPDLIDIEDLAWETLNSGKVIPGYGHAVLRVTDPRFTGFIEFGKKYCKDDPVFKMVDKIFEVVPKVLGQIKKISNPWPNVDAASGALLAHYGLTELTYYTVLFGVSRTLGICAQGVIARSLCLPIIRPKSVTNQWLKNVAHMEI